MYDHPVFLLGMPRSGTTWLSQLFEAHPNLCVRLSPNYSYPLKNRLTESSSRDEWTEILRLAATSDDPFLTQNWRRDSGDLPHFDNKQVPHHLVIKDTRFHDIYLAGMEKLPAARCLYVVRHPCAILESWRKSKEFPSWADFEQEWRTGACRKREGSGEYWGFDDWCRLTERYLDLQAEHPEQYLVFRYEEVVRNPEAMGAKLFAFFGESLDDMVKAFIVESHSRHDPGTYSVFKGLEVLDAWKQSFPPDIEVEIRRSVAGTRLEEFLT